MGDAGEYWREHREYRRSKGLSVSGHRRPAQVVKFTKDYAERGFRQCSQWHWQARVQGDVLDYWPSKSKWRFRNVTTQGPKKKLFELIANFTRPL